jgi:RNA recognition motif-containing protein
LQEVSLWISDGELTPWSKKDMKKLFVGSLSWNISDTELSDAFSRFGTVVEAKVITDRESGRSRGFGFVSFEDDAAADEAVSAMNGTTLDGREINVNEAQDKPRDNNRSGGGGGRGGGRGGFGGGGGGRDRGGSDRW